MRFPRSAWFAGSALFLISSGFLISKADDASAAASDTPSAQPECSFFGDQREGYVAATLKSLRPESAGSLTTATNDVTALLGYVPGGSRSYAYSQNHQPGSIDSYIYADFKANGVTPAGRTTDWEFIRRATLDLTGRIPKPDRVLSFVADSAPDKRAKLIDELIASSAWLDKWTMYFGDLYKNTDNRPSSGLRRFPEGRNAFHVWIWQSLAADKPYNQMATELIASQAESNYDNGPINWLVGGVVTGGPQQDITDQMTANTAETFLGLAHVNCLLCHNGRGHLDTLSLWGKSTTRYQAWQLSAFLSHTQAARTPVDPSNTNIYYWSLKNDTKGFTTDYALNTTTGNRPARQPLSPTCKAGQSCSLAAPVYLNGQTPNPGEDYRVALARFVTSDFQFARAAVNYVWAQFFGRGIVDPPNTFDPARLDPDNPPPAPWTLQPSNARLLNALAQRFIENRYSVKWLMREIANSDAYQLSSRYAGQWNPAWEGYFARKFVRRLWAEEIHDALAQSSGLIPSYNVAGYSTLGFPNVSWAMQLPDVVTVPGGTVTTFLDNFLRGNRDDADRKSEGSVMQALSLMNDPLVAARLQPTGAAASPLIATNLSKADADLVNTVFLAILSRYPSDAEKTTALASLKSGDRTQAVRDLVWSLYNKVDFVFNY